VILDLVALIGTALDQRRFHALARSAQVTSLHRCTLLLLGTLDRNLPSGESAAADTAESARMGRSYAAATETLGRAGVAVRPDGLDDYVAERRRWEPMIRRVAPGLGYGMDEVDRRRPNNRPGRPDAAREISRARARADDESDPACECRVARCQSCDQPPSTGSSRPVV
jgi:hypothetical protein